MFLILRLEDEAWGEFSIFDLLLFVLFMWLKVDENAKICGICKKLSNNVIGWFVLYFSYFIHILCTVLLLGIPGFHWHLYCVTFHKLEWSKESVLFSFPQHYNIAIFASSFYVNLNIIEYKMLNFLWCCSTSEYFTQWPLAVLVYFISYYIFLVYYQKKIFMQVALYCIPSFSGVHQDVLLLSSVYLGTDPVSDCNEHIRFIWLKTLEISELIKKKVSFVYLVLAPSLLSALLIEGKYLIEGNSCLCMGLDD